MKFEKITPDSGSKKIPHKKTRLRTRMHAHNGSIVSNSDMSALSVIVSFRLYCVNPDIASSLHNHIFSFQLRTFVAFVVVVAASAALLRMPFFSCNHSGMFTAQSFSIFYFHHFCFSLFFVFFFAIVISFCSIHLLVASSCRTSLTLPLLILSHSLFEFLFFLFNIWRNFLKRTYVIKV